MKTLAILVGGDPAPGINAVIAAATIEARNQGCRVLGCYDGYKWLVEGNTEHVVELTIDDLSRIHFDGGSIIRTSRTNPARSPEGVTRVAEALKRLGVEHLITIGGDDTAFASSRVARAMPGLTVAHVPKTIDNDLPLPGDIVTFGYTTACNLGKELVRNLMQDASTTERWFFVTVMGRRAGHLALGIGGSAGATLTVIAEEFAEPKIPLDRVADVARLGLREPEGDGPGQLFGLGDVLVVGRDGEKAGAARHGGVHGALPFAAALGVLLREVVAVDGEPGVDHLVEERGGVHDRRQVLRDALLGASRGVRVHGGPDVLQHQQADGGRVLERLDERDDQREHEAEHAERADGRPPLKENGRVVGRGHSACKYITYEGCARKQGANFRGQEIFPVPFRRQPCSLQSPKNNFHLALAGLGDDAQGEHVAGGVGDHELVERAVRVDRRAVHGHDDVAGGETGRGRGASLPHGRRAG